MNFESALDLYRKYTSIVIVRVCHEKFRQKIWRELRIDDDKIYIKAHTCCKSKSVCLDVTTEDIKSKDWFVWSKAEIGIGIQKQKSIKTYDFAAVLHAYPEITARCFFAGRLSWSKHFERFYALEINNYITLACYKKEKNDVIKLDEARIYQKDITAKDWHYFSPITLQNVPLLDIVTGGEQNDN